VVAFGYFVVTSVFLLPSTETWIGRLSFAALIIAGLPLLLFAWYFAAAPARGSSTLARRVGFAVLSLLPPLALIGIGVTGIIGYTALATELFVSLAQVIIIASVLALALGVLYDVIEAWAAALRARDPARAYFWRRNFLTPLSRLLMVALIIAALRAVQAFFGWTEETPVVGDILTAFNAGLFRFGDTDYTIGRILFGLAAIWLVFWIASWGRRVSYSLFYVNIRDLGIRQSLSVFTQYLIVVVGLLISLTAIGFDVTTLTVFAASLGVGIGFGMQNVINNFISGLLLLVERPLRLGDIVSVGGETGVVEQIGIRSLRLKTFDQFDVIVPNSAVISDTFTNWSRTDQVMRALMTIGFGYDDDPELAVRIVREIIDGYEPILKTPAPQVTLDEFGDSSINIRVAYFFLLGEPISGFDIRNHVLTCIWKAFRENGITIPYPQRDVHLIEPEQPGGGGPKVPFGPDATAPDGPSAPAGQQSLALR
jgi:potassium efflux system protein